MEDMIVKRLLTSPQFHHFVRRIHRHVEDVRYGRDPNSPMRQGQATQDPTRRDFVSHFIEELKNQTRGTTSKQKRQRPSDEE